MVLFLVYFHYRSHVIHFAQWDALSISILVWFLANVCVWATRTHVDIAHNMTWAHWYTASIALHKTYWVICSFKCWQNSNVHWKWSHRTKCSSGAHSTTNYDDCCLYISKSLKNAKTQLNHPISSDENWYRKNICVNGNPRFNRSDNFIYIRTFMWCVNSYNLFYWWKMYSI